MNNNNKKKQLRTSQCIYISNNTAMHFDVTKKALSDI